MFYIAVMNVLKLALAIGALARSLIDENGFDVRMSIPSEFGRSRNLAGIFLVDDSLGPGGLIFFEPIRNGAFLELNHLR